MVEIDPVDDPLDRFIERRISEDEVRRLAAEFESEPLFRSRDGRGDAFADLSRASESDLVDPRVRHKGCARFARTGDDVDHARRQARLLENLREMQGRDRGGLGRLQHHRVPAGQRRGDFPCSHEERKIPRDHLRRDAERSGLPAGEGVFELVGPAGVMEKMRRDERQVEIAALADRLAAVNRLEYGELARLFLEKPRDAEEVFAALRRIHRTPRLFEGAARAFHRRIEVGLARLGDQGVPPARRGIDRGEEFARLRRDELAVDEELVALLERHRKGLRRRSVIERRGEGEVGGGVFAFHSIPKHSRSFAFAKRVRAFIQRE